MECLASLSNIAYNPLMAEPLFLPPVDFATLCKKIRSHRKLKHKEMAALLGVTLQSYQRYESGEREPTGQQAYILARLEMEYKTEKGNL